MNRLKTVLRFSACSIVMLALASGCATNRCIMDVQIPQAVNPEKGIAVKIVRVTDSRVFAIAPRSPSIPSLRDKAIDNKAITSRAIARKRTGLGRAMGDIVLPEGRTVEMLITEALTKAFRDAGYQVAAPDDTTTAAIPVEADIEQFWSWITPGAWSIGVFFETTVIIKCDLASFKSGEKVTGKINLHSQTVPTFAWSNTINKGIGNFISEVRNRLPKNNN